MKTEKLSLSAEERQRIREQADRVLEAERLAMLNAEQRRRIQEQADRLAEAERLKMMERIRENAGASENKLLRPRGDVAQAPATEPESPPSPTGREQSRKGYFIAVLAVIGLALYLVYGVGVFDTKLPKATEQASSGERQQAAVEVKPGQAGESAAPPEQPAAKAEQPVAKAESQGAKAEATSATGTAAQSAEPEIRNAVNQWAEAWSRRDAAAYLAFYAAEFPPPQDLSRSEWEVQRKSKLGKYQSITVTLKNIKVSHAGGDEAKVNFTQDFKADSFKEMGTQKELRLKKIQGRWMIVSEQAK